MAPTFKPSTLLRSFFAIWLEIPRHNAVSCGSTVRSDWHDLRAGAISYIIMSFAIFEVWTKLTRLPCRQDLRFARCMQRFELRQSHLRSRFFRYTANQWVLRTKTPLPLCSRRQSLSAIKLKPLSFVFSIRCCACDAIAWRKIMRYWSYGIRNRTSHNYQPQVRPK